MKYILIEDLPKEKERKQGSDFIHTKILNNVCVQENGIIRDNSGYLIGRLCDDVQYKQLQDESGSLLTQCKNEIDRLAKFLMKKYPKEITGGSAVDIAIRLIGEPQ